MRHPRPGVRWYCWLAANDRRYQAAWGLAVTAPAVRPAVPDWVRRGGGRRRGWGDLVAWLAARLGFRAKCDGCDRRRKWLNRLRTPADLWRRWRGR